MVCLLLFLGASLRRLVAVSLLLMRGLIVIRVLSGRRLLCDLLVDRVQGGMSLVYWLGRRCLLLRRRRYFGWGLFCSLLQGLGRHRLG